MSTEVELQAVPSDTSQEERTFDQVEIEPTEENVTVEGADNPAYTDTETTEQTESDFTIPPMTFVDFMPRLIEEAASNVDSPIYSEFSSVMEQVNQWLKGNPDYQAMKLESFTKKLSEKENAPDLEQVMYHESSYGINKYVRGLRLWLAPRLDTSSPIQEIGYITTMPEPSEGEASDPDSMLSLFKVGMFNARAVMPTYCGYKEMMDKLNKFLKKKPLPGSVLSIENVKVKYDENSLGKCMDSESMSWADCGKDDRIYMFAIRIYYIIGKPTFEVVSYHDEAPVCQNNWETMSKLRYCPFTTVVQRGRAWLRNQKGIRVVNMQTVDVFCDRTSKGEARVHHDKTGYVEAAGKDAQFARVLRIFYIVDPKSSVCPYETVNLTSRLFIPTRRGDWGKNCETFSKTMQRVIKWLQLTKVPIFGVETVIHPFTPDSYGTGVRDDSSTVSLIAAQGKYFITTVRLYFPCEFEEPDPKLLPQPEEEEGWWACTVS
ncbi:uncharacterized protein LOC128222938 [Mya arenaria]|nr:uncharacterized protein LOC128222938 [Mya arenaria]